ncbi:MAG: hypothetical protein Q7S22_07500 [Candidatus Micrarchaeota archaeon]|nr:hypothetical protein [Candidatus Micrarchaeota archaeon]
MTLLQHSVQPPSSTKSLSPKGRGHFRCPDPDTATILSNLVVIKITGKICDPANLSNLARDVGALTRRGMKVIIVHGGGRQIDAALSSASIVTQKKDGIRITPKEAIPHVVSAMKAINAEVGAAIRNEVDSVACIDNSDFSIISATRKDGYGEVGDVSKVDTRTITLVLRRSEVVVLSCLGKTGDDSVNINADDVAAAVATSMKAKKLLMLSDVPGIISNDQVLPLVDNSIAHVLLANGTITGGMVVKVTAMLDAAQHVGEVIVASGNTDSILGVIDGSAVCTRFSSVA